MANIFKLPIKKKLWPEEHISFSHFEWSADWMEFSFKLMESTHIIVRSRCSSMFADSKDVGPFNCTAIVILFGMLCAHFYGEEEVNIRMKNWLLKELMYTIWPL